MPLREAIKQETPILSDWEIRTLFSEMESIIQLNKQFYLDWKAQVEKYHHYQTYGHIYMKYHKFFQLYFTYCNNYKKADKLLV